MFSAAIKSGATGSPKDPQFNYVTMLLHGDGTNGAQNNTFLDSSTNNFTITRNGNTTQGTFTPYGSNWSNYFDGTGDTLNTASNAAFGLGTGAWTLEAFVYPTVAQTDNWIIATNDAGKLRMRVGASGYLSFFTDTGNVSLNSTTVVTVNAWSHVAICYDGTTLSLFQNGTRTATSTVSISNGSANACYIGSNTIGGSFWNGYISNARVVKGTAVYSGATYTVPTAPLTAITNTSLLTCADNRFIDDSTNNFTITKSGDVSVQRFSPFSPTTAYFTSVIGGSGYFDGSGDYLNLGGQSAFAFGLTNSFTIQFWFYATAISADVVFYDGRPTTTQGLYPTIYLNGSTKVVSYVTNSTEVITGTTTIVTGQWYYVTLSRNSGSTRLFVNGVQQGSTYTDVITYANPANRPTIMQSGYASNGYLTGYVTDFQVINGTGYSSVTVPTTPLTAITNTQLLCNFTNAGILDNAEMNDLETVGNAQISTSVKKYGTGSMYFDGSGDWLQAPNNAIYNLGGGDFTIEFWLYVAVNPGAAAGIVTKALYSGGTGYSIIYYPGYIAFIQGSTLLVQSATSSISTTTWTHVAITRSGTSGKFFINGTQSGSTGTINNFTDSSTVLAVGALDTSTGWNGNYPFNGYIDDLRITKGYARYTSNFTAPTAAFPNN